MPAVWLWLLIVMNLLWAGTVSMYKYLGAYPAAVIATVRYGLAAVCLVALWPWLPGKGPRGKDIIRALVMGVIVFSISPHLQIAAVQRGQAGDTSLLIALEPLIVAVGAALLLHEKIAARRWWGFGLGILGMTLISQIWRDDVQALKGLLANLIFVSSFVCEAAFSIMGKPMLERVSPLKLVAVGLLGGTVANGASLGMSAQTIPTMPGTAWLMLVYLALICTAFGYALWYFAIERAPVSLAALTVFVQPVAGLLLAVLWLREDLHWGQFWGSVVIVTGLIIGLRSEPARKVASQPANTIEPCIGKS
jgi:drug/metabolite transporter (DMT)-like permease